MPSSFTTNKSLEKPANGEYVDTWNVPVNADMDVIDQAFGGTTSLNATGGNAVLSASQYRSLYLNITGAISGNVTYTIPAGIGGRWTVRNATTDSSGGPWTITIASGGAGSSYVVPRNLTADIFSDGTNITAPIGTIADDSITTVKILNEAVTYGKIASADIATSSQYRNNTSNKLLETDAVWSSADLVTLTDAATIAVDLSTGINFTVTLGGNRTLGNPTNTKVGQSGIIVVNQDGTGGRTLAFGGNYKFANGVAPSPDTTAGRVNIYCYVVISASFIMLTLQRGVR